MKTAIDHHVCVLNGDPHRLRLQWVATEPRFSTSGYLLAIDILSNASQTAMTTLHVMTRPGATRQGLLELIDDAVDEQVRRLRLETGGNDDEPSREVFV